MFGFNPQSPHYRRGILLASIYVCSFSGLGMILSDFGKQDHVFTAVQKRLFPKVDKLFGVTDQDIEAVIALREKEKKIE